MNQVNEATVQTTDQSGVISPVLLRSLLKDGTIISEASDVEIAEIVLGGQVVILKNAFDASAMLSGVMSKRFGSGVRA